MGAQLDQCNDSRRCRQHWGRAFAGCHSLPGITLPDGLSSIEDVAFSLSEMLSPSCIGLTNRQNKRPPQNREGAAYSGV